MHNFQGIAVVTFIISINSLLLVSFDRFLRIAHHVNYDQILTKNVTAFLIISTWIATFIVFLVAPMVGWSCAHKFCCADEGELYFVVYSVR